MADRFSLSERVKRRLNELPPRGPTGSLQNMERERTIWKIQRDESRKMRAAKYRREYRAK